MIEYETLIDRVLGPSGQDRAQLFDERAHQLARGDFNDPADRVLDRAATRNAITRRLLGRS